jgi:predicted nucleic acid-binding protein
MYLLDTNVLSELQKQNRDPKVFAWVQAVAPADLFVSAISIGEIEFGIARLRGRDPVFEQRLSRWLDVTLRLYGERVLPLTTGIARRWGRLAAQQGNRQLDLIIAATALEHGLIVATRNVSDFAPTGVPILNPFDLKATGNP